ncbi:M24 family metallopeptidase [soil metagenome]
MNEAKQQLVIAEQKAKELFNVIEQRGLIVHGKLESELVKEIVQIAKDDFGIEEYWHKKIVRAGVNTLQAFNGNPPDCMISADDIVILDFGPIFEGFEADLGRTYILGNNPLKLKLKKDVEAAWYEAKKWYDNQSILTGAEFFNYLTRLTKRYGYEFGNEIAGHLVGPYPHEQPNDPNDLCFDIHPDNHSSILVSDKWGNSRNWILEIQFVDRKNNIGGFFEQLLNQAV